MIKVYLSGPITGKEETYEKEFNEMKANIEKIYHYEVVSPIDYGENEDERKSDKYSIDLWFQYMKKDLDLVSQCDAIALMSGWDKSPGCVIELIAALKKGLKVIALEDEDWAETDVGSSLLNLYGIDIDNANETFYRKLKTEIDKELGF